MPAMAGGKGKHSKSKGKSKRNSSSTVGKKPEVLNSKLDLEQVSKGNPDGPVDNKGKNPTAVVEPFSAEQVLSDYNTSSLEMDGNSKRTNPTAAIKSEIGAPSISSTSDKRSKELTILNSDFLSALSSCFYKAWLESTTDDSKNGMIVELAEEIRGLQEEVKKRKEWAEQKVMDSARRLSDHNLELRSLRMEKKDKVKKEDEIIHLEMPCMVKLQEAEKSLRLVNLETSFITDAVNRMEIENDQIRAEIGAFKLNGSESERALKEVLKREEKYAEKLADVEKQTSVLQSHHDKEKHKMLQLQQQLLPAKNEAQEAEMKWRREIKEKENMLALLAQETRQAETQIASSKYHLLKLRQQVDIDCQLTKDKCQILQDELSRLHMSRPIEDLLPDNLDFLYSYSRPIEDLLPQNLDFLYKYDEATSSESRAQCEPSQKTFGHWTCMMCMQNEVSVMFLPCTHQVVCLSCFMKNYNAVGARCPNCHVEIEDNFKVYGPTHK